MLQSAHITTYLLVNCYIPVIYSTNTATGLDMVVDGEGKNMPTILLPTGQKYKHDKIGWPFKMYH